MTQVYTGTLTSLAWRFDAEKFVLRQPCGAHLQINVGDFERDFIPLGHIDHLPAHQQRVIAEHARLNRDVDKLGAFLETEIFQTLHIDEQGDMRAQLEHMCGHLDRLGRRIARFTKVAQDAAVG